MKTENQIATRNDQAVAKPRGENGSRGPAIVPSVDIYEDSHAITLWADLPGVSRENLDVRLEDGNLIIEAKAIVNTPEGLRLNHAEVRDPRYARAFLLGADFDASRIDANLLHGVLRLTIPRREEARPRRIEVLAG